MNTQSQLPFILSLKFVKSKCVKPCSHFALVFNFTLILNLNIKFAGEKETAPMSDMHTAEY